MNLESNISVIIPVFNAEKYIAKAVESALNQNETKEVILIEDASVDNSLEVCKALAETYEKVKLHFHEGNVNKGAGQSRNLGIKKATGDFIAFLDADDFFLSDRFRAEREIFVQKPLTDGVYGALGFYYYSEEGKKNYKELGFDELTTIPEKITPNDLFFSLLGLHEKINGNFSLDTLTLKRAVFFGKTEMFNDFELYEDSVFLIQLSLNCIVEPGVIHEPVAMRGVHDNNRIVNHCITSVSRVLYWQHLYNWSLKSNAAKKKSKLFQAYLMREKLLVSGHLKGIIKLIVYSLTNKLFLKKGIFFYPAAKHVLGKGLGPYILNYKERIQINIFKSHPYSSIKDLF